MADIIDFSQYTQLPDPDAMNRDALLRCLQTVRVQIAQLDEQEPKGMGSGKYEVWGDFHDEPEDPAEEILDLLDEM